MSAASNSLLAESYHRILEQIRQCAIQSGRDPTNVRLIAVSKTRTFAEVLSLAKLGQHCFGENTLQDAMTKISQFPYRDENNTQITPEWHFIGHLQSKKAGKVASHFQWVHTVDRIKVAEKLSAAMLQQQAGADRLQCLIQVNVSGESSKSGVAPGELDALVENVLQQQLAGIELRGLMTIGVRGNDSDSERCFQQLRELQQGIARRFDLSRFDQLSMGMSDDYCLAIAHGATLVRVGSAIFGPRDYAAG
jgi:pyridoxal phosphate enzyme (YggS family)